MKLKSLSQDKRRSRANIQIVSFLTAFVVVIFLSVIGSSTQAQPSTNPFESGKIIIGVRTAAEEIGSSPRERFSGGACGVLGSLIDGALGDEIDVRYEPIQNNYIGGGFERYDGLRQELVHVECGPNSEPSRSTPPWAQGIRFSKVPLYRTGIKLLIKQSVVDNLPNAGGVVSRLVDRVDVLVSSSTTTRTELESYSNLSVIPINSRDEALDLLEENENYAYASDALIIKTLLNRGVEKRENNGEVIQQSRSAYRNEGYTTYPADGSYLLGETEKYVIAIKENTVYADELMNAVEEALSSDRMEEERVKLKRAETLNIDISSSDANSNSEMREGTDSDLDISDSERQPPTPEPSPNFRSIWITVIVTSVLLLLILVGLLIYFNSRKNIPTLASEAHRRLSETESRGNVSININHPTQIGATTLQHGTGNTVQVMSREQEQAEISNEIRRILQDISASQLPYREQQKRASEAGRNFANRQPTFARRLAIAVREGTISAVESAIDHPLASFFVDSFTAFIESGK